MLSINASTGPIGMDFISLYMYIVSGLLWKHGEFAKQLSAVFSWLKNLLKFPQSTRFVNKEWFKYMHYIPIWYSMCSEFASLKKKKLSSWNNITKYVAPLPPSQKKKAKTKENKRKNMHENTKKTTACIVVWNWQISMQFCSEKIHPCRSRVNHDVRSLKPALRYVLCSLNSISIVPPIQSRYFPDWGKCPTSFF